MSDGGGGQKPMHTKLTLSGVDKTEIEAFWTSMG